MYIRARPKHPGARLDTIRAAASCASRSRAGSWWGSARRRPARRGAGGAGRRAPEHGHLQEVILQNFVAHPRYYGAEPAEIADGAQRSVRRGAARAARLGHADLAGRHAGAGARRAAADARRGRADPAQPLRLVAAARGGGGHRPGRPVGQRRPHLARTPLPVRPQDAQAAGSAGLRAHRAALRLPPSTWTPSGSSRAFSTSSRPSSGASSRGAARAGARTGRSAASSFPAPWRAHDGLALTEQELTALFGETRPEAIEEMRQAADELRLGAGRRHRDLRRQPQHQRLEHLHGGLRVLRLRPGAALARRLRALRGGVPPARAGRG